MIHGKQVQGGFFDADMRLQDISKQGDPLEKLDNQINWEELFWIQESRKS